MSKINLRLAVPLQCLVLGLAMVSVLAGKTAREKALADMLGLELIVALDEDVKKATGMTRGQITDHVELQLSKYGVDFHEPYGNQLGGGNLRISVEVLETSNSGYAFMVEINLYFGVMLSDGFLIDAFVDKERARLMGRSVSGHVIKTSYEELKDNRFLANVYRTTDFGLAPNATALKGQVYHFIEQAIMFGGFSK